MASERNSRPRSAPHTGLPPARSASRKIFNCIVDDTALVAGVKRSTRNGLRQWVKNGQIRLFVPLYALEQLRVLRDSDSRHGEDVRETLEWLDQATTKYPNAIALQGGDEVFDTWAEVENFAVPPSLFSELDHDETQPERVNDHSVSTDGFDITSGTAELDLNRSPSSSSASHIMHADSTDGRDAEKIPSYDSGSVCVPTTLQPLFNYILWRIHQEVDPAAALESFIFLCNDPRKAHLAKGFEVRCKRLEQLRDAVSREDRETRNKQTVQHRSTQSVESTFSLPQSNDTTGKTPPIAPAAMLRTPANVIDPDAFDRTTTSPKPFTALPARGAYTSQRAGRGNVQGRGGKQTTKSPHLRDRNTANSSRGRGYSRVMSVDSEIDPNSFQRQRGNHNEQSSRKLWTPT